MLLLFIYFCFTHLIFSFSLIFLSVTLHFLLLEKDKQPPVISRPLQEEAPIVKPETRPAANFSESFDHCDIINNAVTSLKLQPSKKRTSLKENISSHVEFVRKVSTRTRNLFTVAIVDFGYINPVTH